MGGARRAKPRRPPARHPHTFKRQRELGRRAQRAQLARAQPRRAHGGVAGRLGDDGARGVVDAVEQEAGGDHGGHALALPRRLRARRRRTRRRCQHRAAGSAGRNRSGAAREGNVKCAARPPKCRRWDNKHRMVGRNRARTRNTSGAATLMARQARPRAERVQCEQLPVLRCRFSRANARARRARRARLPHCAKTLLRSTVSCTFQHQLRAAQYHLQCWRSTHVFFQSYKRATFGFRSPSFLLLSLAFLSLALLPFRPGPPPPSAGE